MKGWGLGLQNVKALGGCIGLYWGFLRACVGGVGFKLFATWGVQFGVQGFRLWGFFGLEIQGFDHKPKRGFCFWLHVCLRGGAMYTQKIVTTSSTSFELTS